MPSHEMGMSSPGSKLVQSKLNDNVEDDVNNALEEQNDVAKKHSTSFSEMGSIGVD